MDSQTFKDNIDLLVLQGKLLPQDPNDEPASVLLERIKKEKEQLIKDKKIKKDKNESFIFKHNNHYYEKIGKNEPQCIDDEIPWDIPESWEWCTLSNILTVEGGKRVPKGYKLLDTPTNHVYIRVTNMKNGTIVKEDLKYIDEEVYKKISKYVIHKDDLYITVAGTIGQVGIVPDFFDGMNLTENANKLTNIFINKLYLKFIISSKFVQNQFNEKTTKVAQPKLAIKRILSTKIPLPPLNEQNRIAKFLNLVNEYCDLNELLDDLNKNFINNLKKLILDDALQGKLLPQDPNDEPASVLLERIKKEKEQLIKDKKIKKDKNESFIFKHNNHYYEKIGKNEPQCIDDEILFEIPEKWIWIRLNSFAQIVMGQSPKGEFVKESEEGIEFHQGKIFFGEKILEKSDKTTIKPTKISPPNSILLCVRAPVGKINFCDREICIGRGLASIKPYIGESLDYLYFALLTYEEEFKKKSTGSTFKAITKEVVEKELIPIPPLEEQNRIVETVKELMLKMNDFLEDNIN